MGQGTGFFGKNRSPKLFPNYVDYFSWFTATYIQNIYLAILLGPLLMASNVNFHRRPATLKGLIEHSYAIRQSRSIFCRHITSPNSPVLFFTWYQWLHFISHLQRVDLSLITSTHFRAIGQWVVLPGSPKSWIIYVRSKNSTSRPVKKAIFFLALHPKECKDKTSACPKAPIFFNKILFY